jgi:hypothetical protein
MKAIFLLAALITIGAPFLPIQVGHVCGGTGMCIECFDQHGNMTGQPTLTHNSTIPKGCVPVILF